MKKKCFALLLTVVMAVGLLSLSACSGTGETPGPDGSAAPATSDPTPESTPEPTPPGEVVASGDCGENVTWTLGSNGLLTISGTGPMESYFDGGQPWRMLEDVDEFEHPEVENVRKVVIEDGITRITSDSFSFCVNLTNVTIPASVTSIDSAAFRMCSSLTSVTIPDGITDISRNTFQGCSSLTEMTIPNSVTTIGTQAFAECSSLIGVTIPNSVTEIGRDAFAGCSSLVGIEVASGNANYTSVNGVLFNADQTALLAYPAGKNDSSYSIPASVTYIESYAFADCSSLTSVTIPDGIPYIEENTFQGCSSLTSVTIPDGISYIGENAFQGCSSLTSVFIPASVEGIGHNAFEGCNNLTDIYYVGSERAWNWIGFDISDDNDPLLTATIHYNS